MGILSWIVVGLIAGVLAKVIMPGRDPGGFVITVLLGIIGAIVGGFLVGLVMPGDLITRHQHHHHRRCNPGRHRAAGDVPADRRPACGTPQLAEAGDGGHTLLTWHVSAELRERS